MTGRNPNPLTQGDIAKLIEREYQGLRSLIFRKTGDIQVASDVLNEAICITWEKWLVGKISRPAELAGYIFRVALNLLRNRNRTFGERSDRRADSQLLESIAASHEAHDGAFQSGMALKVREIMRGLGSRRDCALLVRFYLEEEDKESICRDLGLTSEQFVKTLHRARTRLRVLLEAGGVTSVDLNCVLLI